MRIIGGMDMILHITTWSAWQTAVSAGTYTTDSLTAEGFIHCSTVAQLLIPANERFRGQTDLVLLCIDPQKLQYPLVYEDCYETGIAFPHIYGPLNTDAVLKVVKFPPKPDGFFEMPAEVA